MGHNLWEAEKVQMMSGVWRREDSEEAEEMRRAKTGRRRRTGGAQAAVHV